MKKLMITAAAVLCATLAVNAEGVESGIVGYASSDLNSGNKRAFVSPMFSSVGASTGEIRLGDIVPTSTSAVGMNRVIIYTLTSSGKTDQSYIWGGSYWKHNNVDASDETIPAGTGLWVLCTLGASVPVQLQSSGEVNTTSDLVLTLNGGNKRTALGNGFPVGVKFKDIVPEAVTEGQTIGMNRVIIYTLTSSGKTDQSYIWGGSYWKHNNVDASEETVPAGAGLWVLCTIAETTTRVNLRIANPLK